MTLDRDQLTALRERKWRVPCPFCDEGFAEGCTCMDSTCCCLEPDPPLCGHCNGRGYHIVTELTDDNYEDAIEVTDQPEEDRG